MPTNHRIKNNEKSHSYFRLFSPACARLARAGRYFRKNQGFTLIEVMVALSIMVMLLGLSLTYSQRGSRQIILFKERARVMQEIARARSLTATLFKEKGEKICGYGAYITKENPSDPDNKLILYKDLPLDGETCTIQQNSSDQEYDSGEAIDEFVLDPNVYFCSDPSEATDIFFLPPKPDLFFDGVKALPDPDLNGGNTTEQTEISICLTEDPSQKSTITVNLLGQISSE
ncbi:MAG: type II secretion system protein [bacterium]|nr:type II secretion system protein [bacterium]